MSTRSPERTRGLRLTLPAAIARIGEREPSLRAFIATDFARAREHARRLDGVRENLPLRGVPFSLKDVWDVSGYATTSGARIFRRRIPSSSGRVCRAFEAAGGILVGKTNLSDLAMTPECASSMRGRTNHPLDPLRTPGGSSGGAAAAVASGMVAFDWGSDFGGSIRLPAAFCGVVGLRLSSSSWPPDGHNPEGDRSLGLNGMGPLAASIADCRSILTAVEPALCRAPPSTFVPVGLAVWSPDEASSGEWPAFDACAVQTANDLGLPVESAGLPTPGRIDALFTSLLAASIDRWLPRSPLHLEPAALWSLVAGPLGLPSDIHPDTAIVLLQLRLLALRARRRAGHTRDALERLRDAVGALWSRGRVIIAPTSTWPAPPHRRVRRTPGITAFVKLANLVDATALTLPWGTFPGGLPRGLQLVGPPGSERALLDLATRLESTREGVF